MQWKKPFELKSIISDFSDIKQAISAKRNKEIESLLSNIKTIKRSEEGGNGVIFFDCKPIESSTITDFVIKFVNEPRSILCADRLFQAMGFVTPKSSFVTDASPLKKKLIAATLDHLSTIQTDNQSQVKKQTDSMRCILIMSTLDEPTSFRQLPGEELINLFNLPNTLNQLGKMIFIDLLINNTDRLNTTACNLGNMLLNESGILHLLDHEFKISPELLDTIKSNLKTLLEGKMTAQIIDMMEQALKYDRKKLGAVILSIDLKQKMKKNLEEGFHQGAIQLCQLFNSPSVYNNIFQPYLEESEKLDGKTFMEVVKYVQKLIK